MTIIKLSLTPFDLLGGGDKRIMEIKTDFKERAKPKVGSKDNMTYQPGKIKDLCDHLMID